MTADNQATTATGLRIRLMLLALVSFTVVLDLAGVVILLPSIQGDLAVDLSAATWVIAAFTLAWAAAVPLGFVVAVRYAPSRTLGPGLWLLGMASVVAALAPTWPELVCARVGQGTAAAVVSASAWLVTQDPTTGPHDGRCARAVGTGALLGAAAGPVLPGMLATWATWRAQFWLEAAMAVGLALVLATGRDLVPARSPSGRRSAASLRETRTQMLGVLVVAGAAAAVIEVPSHGWNSAIVLLALAAAILVSGGLLIDQFDQRGAAVSMQLLRRRSFGIGNAVRALTEFTSLGIFLPLSGHLQLQLGHSPLAAGLILLSIIVGALLTAPVAEHLEGRIDPRWLLIPGFALVAAGAAWLARLPASPPWWSFIVPLIVVGAGTGALEAPADSAVRRDTPAGAEGPAWVVSEVSYLLGIGTGIAVTSAAWEGAGADGPEGVRAALYLCAASAVVGACLAALLSDRARHT